MKRRMAAAMTALALLPLTACSDGLATTDQLSYQIDQSLSALVIDARAGNIAIEVGDGPITVTEEHSYSGSRPATAHQVEGQTLRLTESGCRDDGGRCDVGYRIRLPKAMSAQINARAGAVMVNGLAGDLHVATLAGSVEGRGLSSAEVSVTTEAGETNLAFAKAPALVRATTRLGAVELRLPGNAAYAVDVQTTVGDSSVDVDQNPASAHRIEVRSRVGSVKIARHLPQPWAGSDSRASLTQVAEIGHLSFTVWVRPAAPNRRLPMPPPWISGGHHTHCNLARRPIMTRTATGNSADLRPVTRPPRIRPWMALTAAAALFALVIFDLLPLSYAGPIIGAGRREHRR